MKGRIITVLAVTVCLVLCSGLASAQLYVARADQPNKSITTWLAQAVAGDSIAIEAGVYTDGAHGGNETFPLQMKAGVSLIGTNPENTIISAPGAAIAIGGDSAGVRIEGISVEGANAALQLDTMSIDAGVTIKDSKFTSVAVTFERVVKIYNTNTIVMDGCDVTSLAGSAYLSGSPGYPAVKAENIRVTDSRFTAIAGGSEEEFVVFEGENVLTSDVVINGFPANGWLLMVRGGKTVADNLIVNGSISFFGEALVKDSKFTDIGGQFGSDIKVATSMIEGNIYPYGPLKVFQCYDSNLDPVVYP